MGESPQAVVNRTLPSAVSFGIDDVVVRMAQMSQLERRKIRIATLPSLVPPFPSMFTEWSTFENGGRFPYFEELRNKGDVRSIGVLTETIDWNGISLFLPRDTQEEVRWTVSWFAFWGRARDCVGPIIRGHIFLAADGTSAHWTDGTAAATAYPTTEGLRDSAERNELLLGAEASKYVRPVLFACSLANCNNVRLEEQEARYENRQDRRNAERRGDPPRHRFYTLAIDPMRKSTEGGSGPSTSKGVTSMHICRGHFSHYSEERPLFGKYSGTFWVPAHVRGISEVGVVGKDYRVKAPRDTGDGGRSEWEMGKEGA